MKGDSMTKTALLSGLALIALIALIAGMNAADAGGCNGGQCTPVNSVVTGKATASGVAFEKAGIAAIGSGNVQVGVVGVAGSHSTATLQRDTDCTAGCITGSANTINYAGYNAAGTGDLVIGGGVAGTHGQTNVDLTSQANNDHGETALATISTGATAGTLVGSFDIGHGSAAVDGFAGTGVGSAAEACAAALEQSSSAYTRGDSAYLNEGAATGLLAGAGSYGLTHTETLAVTAAADWANVNTVCLLGQCNRGTPIAGVALTGGEVVAASGAGSLDADLAFNGTATTSSTGYSLAGGTLASDADLAYTYGKIGEYKTWGWVGPKWYNFGWTKHDINGVNGLTGTASTDATAVAGAGATGDLVGAYAGEQKEAFSTVEILTVGQPR